MAWLILAPILFALLVLLARMSEPTVEERKEREAKDGEAEHQDRVAGEQDEEAESKDDTKDDVEDSDGDDDGEPDGSKE